MLSVAIHHQDGVSARCRIQAGAKGRLVAEVAAESDRLDAPVGPRQLGQDRAGIIGRAVVDIEKPQLVGQGSQRLQQARVESAQAGAFVVYRNDEVEPHGGKYWRVIVLAPGPGSL